MKKVWVNRFNADRSMKPMNEWELKECFEWDDFYTQIEDVFYFRQKSGRRWTQKELNKGDLSDQRGDGWFYVADGDLPPLYQEVITFDKNGHYEVSMLIATVCDTLEWYGCEPVCWQPITPPRFMNAL